MSEDKTSFSPDKVFLWLFLFTAAEVAYGVLGSNLPKMALWGGLGIFAFLKAWLIAVYFMHLKFEGWVVKSLVLPTPLLIQVIWGYISPDVSNSQIIDHPIGSMYDVRTGEVAHEMGRYDEEQHEAIEEGAEEH